MATWKNINIKKITSGIPNTNPIHMLVASRIKPPQQHLNQQSTIPRIIPIKQDQKVIKNVFFKPDISNFQRSSIIKLL